MKDILRWVFFVPAALLAGAFTHFMMVYGQGFSMGSDEAREFWGATDMQGRWIGGTIGILFVRGADGFASTWVAAKMVPRSPAVAARIWFGLMAVAMLAVISFSALSPHVQLGFSTWYRTLLETAVLLTSSWAAMANAVEEQDEQRARSASE